MNILFHQKAFAEYQDWIVSGDKKNLTKLNSLLKEIMRTPYEGTGQPEPLKHDLSGYWSRRINKEDRIVYEVRDDVIIILSCKFHY